ncbi:pilus assembly PilX N-terminal domain-containing protein [Massilia sp. UMI-21]|nr:pilus assembly PilX N-terminal domain-containing protein [Massilia sp. UMI-21]
MKTNPFHPRRVRRCAGVGLVTAIFLLVVLAGLAVAAVRISSVQQASSSLDLDGARAYQAARAGIEWGLYQRLRNNACPNQSFALPADSALARFTVSVTCTQVDGPLDAAGSTANTTRWRIVAVACNAPVGGVCTSAALGGGPDFVRRRLEVLL